MFILYHIIIPQFSGIAKIFPILTNWLKLAKLGMNVCRWLKLG